MWEELRQRGKKLEIEERKVMAEAIEKDLEILREMEMEEKEEEQKTKIRKMIIKKMEKIHSVYRIEMEN